MIDQISHKVADFFVFNAKQPVIFTDISFWIFFTFVYAIFTVIHKQYTLRNLFLFLVSVFFYYKTSGFFFGLLLFTIANEYWVAIVLERSQHALKRKLLVLYSILINIGLLCYFKYAYFFTDSYNQIFHTQHQVINHFAHWSNGFFNTRFNVDKILLPVGISFYTFHTLSYTIEVYRRKMNAVNNFFDFGFYVAFFPVLLAGPIVKAKDFIPQLRTPFKLNQYQFGLAWFMIINGLIKKMVVGDYIAINFIDRVFGNPMLFSGVENVLAVIGYSLQVYLDFSGYTDIAIGVALLMGYKIKTNFNSPYKAQSVAEFWKRWHISLSTWLQEYLYIPLGGNKHGTFASYLIIAILSVFIALLLDATFILWVIGALALLLMILSRLSVKVKHAVNTNINLMVTMLLGGLWHGATLNFIIWGGLNGLGLVVYKFWKKISPYQTLKSLPVRFWKILITFVFISFTRIYFRAEDMNQANEVIYKMFSDGHWGILPDILSNFKEVFLLMGLAFIIHWLPSDMKWSYKKAFIKLPAWGKVMVLIVTCICIYQTMSSEMKPFIYFQF